MWFRNLRRKIRNYLRGLRKKQPPSEPKGLPMQKHDFYPGATEIREPDKDIQAPFTDGKPSGITIHYSASRSLTGTINALAERNLKYHILIPRDGRIIQIARLDHQVHHAGKAHWRGVSPNRSHWAICLMSWGYLDAQGRTWAGQQLPNQETRLKDGHLWDACTPEQEGALGLFLRWAVSSAGIDPANICGHDECCRPPGRKVDPGGVLSFSMTDLRQSLSLLRKPSV